MDRDLNRPQTISPPAFSEQRGKPLSTKFSIRPAPRKRPWICKASPIATCEPPVPKTLTATFSLQRFIPDPPGAWYAGTFLLFQTIGTDNYSGRWEYLTWHYYLLMTYPATQDEHAPAASWILGPDSSEGEYEFQTLSLPLPMRAYWPTLTSIGDQWRGTLLVTG